MRYNVWLLNEERNPSPFGPSQITANGIVEAQRIAAATLEELQQSGALTGWIIKTVTEAPERVTLPGEAAQSAAAYSSRSATGAALPTINGGR
jgi:hypothetical protein